MPCAGEGHVLSAEALEKTCVFEQLHIDIPSTVHLDALRRAISVNERSGDAVAPWGVCLLPTWLRCAGQPWDGIICGAVGCCLLPTWLTCAKSPRGPLGSLSTHTAKCPCTHQHRQQRTRMAEQQQQQQSQLEKECIAAVQQFAAPREGVLQAHGEQIVIPAVG